MKTIMTKFIATALAVGAVTAVPASAAVLNFDISRNGSAVESFILDSNAGMLDDIPGYIYFGINNDTLGNNGAYFGDQTTGFMFGTGTIRPGEASVDPFYEDSAPFYTGTGLSLAFGAGSVLTTANGYRVAISSVAPVPEPATWAMMLVGCGIIGASIRYRRRSTKVVYA